MVALCEDDDVLCEGDVVSDELLGWVCDDWLCTEVSGDDVLLWLLLLDCATANAAVSVSTNRIVYKRLLIVWSPRNGLR